MGQPPFFNKIENRDSAYFYRRGILEELEKAHVYIQQLNERIKALEAEVKGLEG